MIGSAEYIDSYEEKIREKLGLKRARLPRPFGNARTVPCMRFGGSGSSRC